MNRYEITYFLKGEIVHNDGWIWEPENNIDNKTKQFIEFNKTWLEFDHAILKLFVSSYDV